MIDLICFAFSGNTSEEILRKLAIDNKFIIKGKKSVDNLINEINTKNPKYILGLGMYTGRDKNNLRLEVRCSNKFRNKTLDGRKLKDIEINNFLKPTKNSKLASGIGNSFCNMVSYKIMKLINDKDLTSQYSFIHIPRKFNANLAAVEIELMLASVKQ